MKNTLRLLGALPVLAVSLAFAQTNKVDEGGTSGQNIVTGNANAGAGEDTSAGGTENRIRIDPQGKAAASQMGDATSTAVGSTTGNVVSGGNSVAIPSTGTTAVSTGTGSTVGISTTGAASSSPGNAVSGTAK